MQCCKNKVKVYDSAFHSHPEEEQTLIVKALCTDQKVVTICIMDAQMQPAPNDCGVYAIAMMGYEHIAIRSRLSQCFEDKQLDPFPSTPLAKNKEERTHLTFISK